ncbi:AzlC family protein [Klebsiella pneumoniae]|nr:AzlC family protein [Klebsiella pneumoniae]
MEIRSIWLSDMKQTLSSLSGDTIKAIVLVCLAVGVVGMSYGSLAVAYGFPLWVPLLLSVSVLAGASEFMFIGIVASGGSPLAAAAAGLLVNARHIPFGVTVRELVGRRALSFIGCHIMNDESVVFGLSQPTPAQRKAAYWLCGAGVALIWPLGTLTGAAAAGLLVNARHIPFGVTVRELVGRRALSFIGCHIMNDESVVFGLSQPTPAQRKAAYWLCGAGVALIWPLGTLTGAAVGKLLPAPETIGLDAVFPAILLALVIPAFKNRTTLIRAASGAALALAAVPFVPTGLPVLLSLFGLLSRKK